ncbi:hypothetical protein TL16_g01022 [Triparma laevis f. inornata]|uniref:Uncharacterized protein n=1 Tax=Triparma laevis f. inornata TaxID=1714386 RepID=A0A9W7DQG7_9STRA|nr:hypothetical protein TL16_g01022 [Triparma laevis f. inornata]
MCSREFFEDESLLAVSWRRILEVLELAMPPGGGEAKKARGKKKKQQKKKANPRKLEILDACAELAYALNKTCAAHFKQPNKSDREEVAEFARRAKNGYEEQLGRESEKALKATISTTMCASKTAEGIIAKLSDLAERCKWLLGADNEVTLDTLYALAI